MHARCEGSLRAATLPGRAARRLPSQTVLATRTATGDLGPSCGAWEGVVRQGPVHHSLALRLSRGQRKNQRADNWQRVPRDGLSRRLEDVVRQDDPAVVAIRFHGIQPRQAGLPIRSDYRLGSKVGAASSRITRTPSKAADQSVVATSPKSRDGTGPSERSAAWSR